MVEMVALWDVMLVVEVVREMVRTVLVLGQVHRPRLRWVPGRCWLWKKGTILHLFL